MKIIDNFKLISSLLKFERVGDCYYLEILLRAKDGNNVQGKHNNGDRTIREILLNHEGHLEELRDEIIKLCHEFNARAYIRLNRRNYTAIGWHYVRSSSTVPRRTTPSSSNIISLTRNATRSVP